MSAPEHLSPSARMVWDQVVLGRPGCEGPDLEAYCTQVARHRDAQERIDREGLVVADEKGRPVPHPAVELERRAQAEIRAWGDRFKPRRHPSARR